jgi:hypothetical protein
MAIESMRPINLCNEKELTILQLMTPIMFISFLFSLALVDFHSYTVRVHDHENQKRRLPAWLHQLLFRPQPYQYVRSEGSSVKTQEGPYAEEKWYYHSKQRGIMKMEVTDAFRIRGTVLAILVAIVAVLLWLVWRGLQMLLRLWAKS